MRCALTPSSPLPPPPLQAWTSGRKEERDVRINLGSSQVLKVRPCQGKGSVSMEGAHLEGSRINLGSWQMLLTLGLSIHLTLGLPPPPLALGCAGRCTPAHLRKAVGFRQADGCRPRR